MLAILEKGTIGDTYMIGADGEQTNKEVLAAILHLMDKPPDFFESVADRPGHDFRYAIDAAKIRTELDWQPQFTNFKLGLADTIDWYKRNEAWWRPQKAATEAKYKEATS